MNYYDWREGPLTCAQCGWSGTGKQTKLSEMFSDGAEFSCPQCGDDFGFQAFPLESEVLIDPRADPADRRAALRRRNRLEQYEDSKLLSPDQLPDLDPVPEALVWDSEKAAGDEWVVIRAGEQVIWRELSWYENCERFGQVASILWQKYGARLKDLEPSQASRYDLHGDAMSSVGYVKRIRASLARGEDPGAAREVGK